MGYLAQIRTMEAAQRRQQRDAQRRFRDLERRTKEQAKLSAIEQARLEVETFENQLEVLLSVHKEQGETWDWIAVAASLSPPSPQRNSYHEQKAKQRVIVTPTEQRDASQVLIEQARAQDEHEFEKAAQAYSEQMGLMERRKNLALQILAGDHKAYTEAMVELNPFAEMSHLGSAIHFTVHTTKLVIGIHPLHHGVMLGFLLITGGLDHRFQHPWRQPIQKRQAVGNRPGHGLSFSFSSGSRPVLRRLCEGGLKFPFPYLRASVSICGFNSV